MPFTGFHVPRTLRHPPLVALLLSLQWTAPQCAALGDFRGSRAGVGAQTAARGSGRSDAHVYYVTEVADRLSDYAAARRGTTERFHDAEQTRLQAAIMGATSHSDKALLEDAAVMNEEARLASQNAFGEMLTLVTTLKQAMGTSAAVESCGLLACGANAYCDSAQDQARCRCQEGYEGNGFVCRPPEHLSWHALFRVGAGDRLPRIADLHVSTLRGGRVAVVYRDVADANRGYLLLGQAGLATVNWSAPVPFSNQSQAFGPVVVELQEGDGLAIAFRDANRGGSGFLVGGRFDGGRGPVRFGAPRAFARAQAQGFGMVALPRSMVAVVFAEHTPHSGSGMLETGAKYGSAILARVPAQDATVEILSKRRFASGPVARISTALLSTTSFLVAFRQAEDTAGGEKAEASCAVAQLHGGELVFDPRALSLEPERGQIWARSLAPLGDGLAAYTYHSGAEQLTKQALLQIDPETHQLGVLRAPVVIGKGFTPYVGSISTAASLPQHQTPEQLERHRGQGPRLLTYFSGAGSTKPRARFCKTDGDGLPDNCKDMTWADHEVSSVSGAPVGDGRLLVLFSDARQVPYYQLVGLMDSL